VILLLLGMLLVGQISRGWMNPPAAETSNPLIINTLKPTDIPASAVPLPTVTPTEAPQLTVAPTKTPALQSTVFARLPTLSEAQQGVNMSIWRANGIDVGDMPSPGTRSFTGTVELGHEYLWTLKWCTLSRPVLDDNLRHIALTYTLNDDIVPQNAVYNYYGDESGWSCYYWMTLVGGWRSGDRTRLRAIRIFDTEINDGQSSYPAGTYVYELVVTVK
jgi:hypothetical protein